MGKGFWLSAQPFSPGTVLIMHSVQPMSHRNFRL